jgi:hypothetical protein
MELSGISSMFKEVVLVSTHSFLQPSQSLRLNLPDLVHNPSISTSKSSHAQRLASSKSFIPKSLLFHLTSSEQWLGLSFHLP